MLLVDLGDGLGLVGPKHHVAAGAARADRKRRTPGASPDNADALQGHVTLSLMPWWMGAAPLCQSQRGMMKDGERSLGRAGQGLRAGRRRASALGRNRAVLRP